MEGSIVVQNKTDVAFTTSGTVNIVSNKSTNGGIDAFRLFSPNTNILIGAFRITAEKSDGTATKLFDQAVVIDDPNGGTAEAITLSGTQVLSATTGAGIVVTAPGDCIWFNGTTVEGAGNSNNRQNGYTIAVPSNQTLPDLQFTNSIAMGNTFDGYSIVHPTGVLNARFNGARAVNHGGDGFDVDDKGVVTLLNITSRDNGTLYEDKEGHRQGRGVAAAASAHIENAHIVHNHLVGVNGEDPGGVLTLIGSTLADNDRIPTPPTPAENGRMGQQINANGAAYIYNTIGDGLLFSDGSDHQCARMIFTRAHRDARTPRALLAMQITLKKAFSSEQAMEWMMALTCVLPYRT